MTHDTPSLPCAPERVDDFLSEPSQKVIDMAASIAAPVGILGAGGKMGLHLSVMLRKALDRGGRPEVPVYAISRFGSLRSRDEFNKFGVDTVVADLLDQNALESLPDLGTMFFLAGVKFGTSDDSSLLRRFNEEMPGMVASRYRSAVTVALSTGCVYPFAGIDTAGCDEETAPFPNGSYAESCRGREMAFERVSNDFKTPVSLIRLNYSVEFRYGVLTDIAQKVLNGEPVDVSTARVNVIWQRDAVDHIIQSSRVATTPALPLNITGSPTHSVRDLAERFARLFKREALFTGREEPTAWLSDPAKSHALFGTPQENIERITEWIAAWLLAGGGTHGKPTKFEARDGKF